MNKRHKAALMLVIWIFSFFNTAVLKVSGADAPGTLSIKNNIIELLVNKQDGRYAIKTSEGSPNRPDENSPLLFSKGAPETTFTTFRIDGKDYIYGNSYNGILMDGSVITAPVTEGMKNTSTWKVGDIVVTQKLEMTDNVESSDVGNVKISYTITNTGTENRTVGTRVLLDTMLGSNDGSAISLEGKSEVAFETEMAGEDIPVYWRTSDSADNPKVVAYGFIKGWGNSEPDRLTIAHWSALSSTKWDYSVNSERNIGSALNDYKSSDSAVALYWEPETLEPGKIIQVETYYGLGNIKESAEGSSFSLSVLAPSKLSIEGDVYKDNPFEILMELDNSLEGSMELSGITAELVLPDGLELAEGVEGSQYFYRIPVNQKQTAKWQVRAANTQKLKVLQYMVRISSMGRELKTLKKFIIIPGFNKDDFEIGYTDVVPRNLYYDEEDNAIQLIGYGFDKLKDKSSYEMRLVNKFGSNTYYPKAEDITVVSDSHIRIKIPRGLQTGRYELSINHKIDILDHTLSQDLVLTSDERYKSRNYGIMLIRAENLGGKSVHSVRLYEKESDISPAEKSSAVMTIRGKVKNISEGRYEVYGDTVAINNDVYYTGYEDSLLSVYKSGDSFVVKGNGELYMQSAMMGKSIDITLKKGHFIIDSAIAAIEDESGYINDTGMIYIGYFPILVKAIKLQNSGELKVDGVLQLENKYFNFLTGVGTGMMESDLKDLSITNKKVNIDTKISIPFPAWKLGNFQSKSYPSKTNVTFYINTIKGAYGFETKAQNLKLRLRDINAKMAFDKNLYPDYFEFENKYGSIPEPIGSTGLAFERIGGGMYGLKSLYDSLKYGILPTGSSIAARADIVDLLTYNARIKGYTLVGLRDIEAVLSSGGIDLDGDGYIYFIDVGDIIGHFDFSGGYIQADLNIYDIIIANAYFGISKHEIKGSISAKVKIPNDVWFIGGETISGFGAGLSTKKIEGSVKFLGIGISIAYTWGDSSVDFDVASASDTGVKGIYTAITKDKQGRDVAVDYGTNIEKLRDISSSYYVCYTGNFGKTLALGADSYNYDAVIDSSVESAIIEMQYSSPAAPVIEVKDPMGNLYALKEGENYKNQIIPAEKSSTGLIEKRIFVTIASPTVGTWKIKSDQAVEMSLFNAREPAVFKSLAAGQEAGKIKVNWTLNKTEGSTVSLYLVNEAGPSGMLELGKDLAGGLGAYECSIPAGVTTGNYRVYAEVKRDSAGFNAMNSEAFEIPDAAAPEAPTGFKVEAAGNGMMKAQWNAMDEADEFRIYAVDDKGEIDRTVKTIVSETGDKTNTVFGGTLKDADGNEYGWFPDRTYSFALYAVKVSGEEGSEAEHISRPAYSEEVYLPVPEPPEFTVSFTAQGGSINVEKDQDGNDVRYTNRKSISCGYQSETDADAVFYVNGDEVDSTAQKNYNLQLDLRSGGNLIEIVAVGENGDKTVKAYEIYYDDKAPDLMVQSPSGNDNIRSGTVLVSGKTTAGSRLYVNGTQMTVAEDGSFNEEYMLSNVQMETITISAMDLAGNRTEYSAEVLNSDAGNVIKAQITPQLEQMRAGDRIQLKLYGITKDNRQVLLDTDKVVWQLYDDEGAASMTEDGVLSAVKPGEIIITAKYALSSEVSYEDALIISVLPRPVSEDDEYDEDEDGDEQTNTPVNNIVRSAGGSEPGILLRRPLNIKANGVIEIPGVIKLRFTGSEAHRDGYIEVHEISDLLQYRQQSGSKDFVSSIFDITVTEGYRFNSPVELTIHFDKNRVKDLKHIAIYVYNEKTGNWDMVGGVADERQHSITVEVPHFSKYAVMENSGMTLMADMDGHWARDAVYRLIDRGIVNGIKSRFEPERTVTRAEFAKMLSISEGYLQNNTDIDLSGFTDDAEIQPWARPYMNYCSKKGWIKGKAVGEAVYMKPKDTITRAEAAAMISRALGLSAVDKGVKAKFVDKGRIPDWAAGYVDQLLDKKLMQGYYDGTFRPDKVLTRAEAAKIFDIYVSERDNGL